MKTYSRNELINKENTVPVRLNKYLSDAGECSRREADRMIENGHVRVDGQQAVLGQKVFPGQIVTIDGRKIVSHDSFLLIAFNKPVGVECTTDHSNPDNIVDFLNYPTRIYPIGRLDKNSRGLILLTNTGEIVNGILRGSNYHEKEYIVTVDKLIVSDFTRSMENGVILDDGTLTRKCKVSIIDDFTFNIIITQGLNRQIRRMCATLGYKVVDLKRIRIMNILLGDLNEGNIRSIKEAEIKDLLNEIGYVNGN